MSIQYGRTDSQGNKVYVLIVNGKEVGSISVDLDLCSVMSIFVDEGMRKYGLGRKLVHFAESLASEKGCPIMRTNPINPEARGFFEKCGYKIDSEEYGSKIIKSEW